MVIVTPGITPPVASDTLPLIAPVVAPTVCAKTGPEVIAMNPTNTNRIRSRLMVAPFMTGDAKFAPRYTLGTSDAIGFWDLSCARTYRTFAAPDSRILFFNDEQTGGRSNTPRDGSKRPAAQSSWPDPPPAGSVPPSSLRRRLSAFRHFRRLLTAV